MRCDVFCINIESNSLILIMAKYPKTDTTSSFVASYIRAGHGAKLFCTSNSPRQTVKRRIRTSRHPETKIIDDSNCHLITLTFPRHFICNIIASFERFVTQKLVSGCHERSSFYIDLYCVLIQVSER